MKSSILLVCLGLSAVGLYAAPALADCTPGETRCGAESEVQRCTNDHTWNTEAGSMCNRSISNHPEDADRARYSDRGGEGRGGVGCTPGISRCGADGELERCTNSNTWSREPGSSCNR